MSEENPYYVYIYLRESASEIADSGTPYYIGKGKGKRAWVHQRNTPRPKDDKNIIIHTKNLSEIDALNLEIELIRLYGRIDINTGILRNLTDGGEGLSGRVFSEEHKRKISESKTGDKSARGMLGKHHDDATKAKMRNSQLGELNHMFGKSLTEEHKQKISNALAGVGVGRKLSKEHCQKISESKTGEKHPMFGKKQTLVTCPHCGKSGGRTMARWHFDNCKEK